MGMKKNQNNAFSRLVSYLNIEKQYKSRSGKPSNQLCRELLKDFYFSSTKFRKDVRNGIISFTLNADLVAGTRDHNIDLVVGTAEIPNSLKKDVTSYEIEKGAYLTQIPKKKEIKLSDIYQKISVIVENKSVITAHGKNAKNRARDLSEFADFAFEGYRNAIVLGTCIIGTSPIFINPDRVKWAREAIDTYCLHIIQNENPNWTNPLNKIHEELGTGSKIVHTFFNDKEIRKNLGSENADDDSSNTLKKMVENVPIKPKKTSGLDALILEFFNISNIDPVKLETNQYLKPKHHKYRHTHAMKVFSRKYK